MPRNRRAHKGCAAGGKKGLCCTLLRHGPTQPASGYSASWRQLTSVRSISSVSHTAAGVAGPGGGGRRFGRQATRWLWLHNAGMMLRAAEQSPEQAWEKSAPAAPTRHAGHIKATLLALQQRPLPPLPLQQPLLRLRCYALPARGHASGSARGSRRPSGAAHRRFATMQGATSHAVHAPRPPLQLADVAVQQRQVRHVGGGGVLAERRPRRRACLHPALVANGWTRYQSSRLWPAGSGTTGPACTVPKRHSSRLHRVGLRLAQQVHALVEDGAAGGTGKGDAVRLQHSQQRHAPVNGR